MLVIVLLLAAGNYFYSIAIKPGGFIKLTKPSNQPPPVSESIEDEAKEWWLSIPVSIVHITTSDGLRLQGYHIANSEPTNRLVILAHGYNGNAFEMAVYAKMYYKMGFDVFAPDNRGHGKSEGDAVGMAWLDRLDYLQWINYWVSQNGGQTELLLHGHSMGGAIVLILSGEKLLPNLKGIISDCAYDSAKNILAWQLKRMFKLPAFPIIPVTSLICRIKAGYYLGEADAVSRVPHSKTPILYIHGDQDGFVPYDMVYRLYNATNPALREIWVVSGAKHIGSIKTEPDKYKEYVENFVSRHFINSKPL